MPAGPGIPGGTVVARRARRRARDVGTRDQAMGALWHGFANMGTVDKNGAFVVARGEGAYIWDDAGTR